MIVRKLLPIKAHFFFFMGALGPVLPQLQVYGKQLGISSVIMGTITGILPVVYLLAKPLFGVIVDIYRDYRKAIFITLIIAMATSYSCIIFVPNQPQNSTSNNSGITIQNQEKTTTELLESVSFWFFVALLSSGTIAFNVINSISDAICFDVIGNDYDYGKQRTWGSIGYGLTALISGYALDYLPHDVGSLKPAVYIMLFFVIFDLASCAKLKLPIIPPPKNIFEELKTMMKYKSVCVFLVFTIVAGIVDGFLTYFLLWYVEDVAQSYGMVNIKLLEGVIVAAQTFGGEILFFFIGDNILEKLGHANCFSVCFLAYALRLGLISMTSSPWLVAVVEFLLQGPSYALTYLTIVAYANAIAPAGASATMQGIAAGLDDGLGYAIGSLLGGFSYRYMGAKETFQTFCLLSLVAAIIHYIIHVFYLKDTEDISEEEAKYTNVPQIVT